MYLEHFGLNEVPFRITPHTEFFFDGANRGATLEALIYAIIHDEGIVKVSGEVGSGKTMLCRVLMERLPDNVVIVYLANPSLSRDDILYAIADDLDLAIPDNARTSAVVRALQTRLIELHSEGRQVVVLIDEAHAVPMETLEEIRLLSNLETSHHKLLQLVMFGQPELDEILARPDMRQLKERITQNFLLEPLRRNDIAEYLDFRMRTAGYRGPQLFSPAAVKLIASASQGLTRRINILAEKSLLATFAAGAHQITPKEVKAAIRDTEYNRPQQATRQKIAMTAIAAAALLAVGATIVANLPMRNAAQAAPGVAVAPDGVPPRLTFQDQAQVSAAPPAALAPAATPAPSPSPATATPVLPVLPVSPESPALAAAMARLQPDVLERLKETRHWIQTSDDRRWFLQLVATNASQIDYAQNYLATADRLLKPDRARLYMADTGKEVRIGIIYGEFPSAAAASAAKERLPAALRDGNPFPRQVFRLK